MTDNATEHEALALFEEMLGIPEAERDAWIAEHARDRPHVAQRLAAMREADRRAALRTGGAMDMLGVEAEPDMIGAYRIVARIGRGGMGAVFLGERMTGDFAHVAAIKVIKQGLLSEALVERFQRERQILARLRHPNIAQLYDGGETADGSPYIVMEYVDGRPLLDWIAEHEPDRAERLRLFMAICDAVAFANRNLVIHRDLTPSNVLVTDEGVVKLIDFGIARPVEEGEANGAAPPGSLASLSLTPGYAAPERISGGEVSTASDVYSLGKLLTRIFPDAQANREFAAIVARATALDPAARYATADALARDVEAWQRGFPVQAIASTGPYLLRKFIGRHPVGVGLASLALLLMLGAFVITLHAYERAENARRAETARFDELRSLASFMLFDLNGQLGRVAGNVAARADLAARAQTYLSALAASRDADPALQLEAARGFNRLAQIQGLPTEPNLGQRDAARANLLEAERLLLALPASEIAVATNLARTRLYLAMIVLHGDGDQDAAAKLMQQVFAHLGGVASTARDRDWLAMQAEALRGQAELLLLSGRLDDLLVLAHRMAAEVERWPAAYRTSPAAEFERANADYMRGLALHHTGSPDAALAPLRAAETRLSRLDAQLPNDPQVLNTLAWAAYEGYGAGMEADHGEARRFLALARRTVDRLTAIEARDQSLRSFAINIRQAQAEMLASDGQFGQAIALQREVIKGREEAVRLKPGPVTLGRVAMAQLILGNIALNAGDRALACESWRGAAGTFETARRERPLLGRDEGFSRGVAANVGICTTGGVLAPVT